MKNVAICKKELALFAMASTNLCGGLKMFKIKKLVMPLRSIGEMELLKEKCEILQANLDYACMMMDVELPEEEDEENVEEV